MIERFSANIFSAFLVDFERAMVGFECILSPPESEDDYRSFYQLGLPSFRNNLNGILNTLLDSKVPVSHVVRMQVRDFQHRLSNVDRSRMPALVEHARITRQAVLNDLSQHLFLYVHSDASKWYMEPLAGWEQAIERFGCSFDIEEARKCMALGRWTAAVFHLMKVVEAAVLELQMFLKDKDVKAHFGSVLSKLEDMTQKARYEHVSASLQPYLPFLRDILSQLHAVKDSWRNKVSHVDARIVPIETFTDELARGVHDATLLLMNKLAAGLPR